MAVASCVYFFRPPSVTMRERFTNTDGPSFDHRPLDDLLKTHVAPGGWVDYPRLKKNQGKLNRYIASLEHAVLSELGRNERLALLINAYNALTLRLILDHYPVSSIKDIPVSHRWKDARWKIGAHRMSLDDIEHKEIRPNFKEPRVHFALVCAAVGCPPLRSEAYVADRLEAQLENQTQYVHRHDRWFRFDLEKPKRVHLTPLYDWYRGDFEQEAGSALDFAARYAPDLKRILARSERPKIKWLDYDWSLNEKL